MSAYTDTNAYTDNTKRFIASVLCGVIREFAGIPPKDIETINKKAIVERYESTHKVMNGMCTYLTDKHDLNNPDNHDSPYSIFATIRKNKGLYGGKGVYFTNTERLVIEHAMVLLRAQHGVAKYPLTWDIMRDVDTSQIGVVPPTDAPALKLDADDTDDEASTST